MRTLEQIAADYKTFRGRCQELCAAEIAKDPTLTLVRGHYFEPRWPSDPKQPHWWCKRPDGTIVDPSVLQFPSGDKHVPQRYTEFNGVVECSNCGKEMKEEEASFDSNYCFCSHLCHGRFVGVY